MPWNTRREAANVCHGDGGLSMASASCSTGRIARPLGRAITVCTALTIFLAVLVASSASAAVSGTTGAVVETSPPTSVRSTANGGSNSDTQIIVFPERLNVLVATAETVDINLPGTYDKNHQTLNSKSVQGETADSYLLHWQRPGAPLSTDF